MQDELLTSPRLRESAAMCQYKALLLKPIEQVVGARPAEAFVEARVAALRLSGDHIDHGYAIVGQHAPDFCPDAVEIESVIESIVCTTSAEQVTNLNVMEITDEDVGVVPAGFRSMPTSNALLLDKDANLHSCLALGHRTTCRSMKWDLRAGARAGSSRNRGYPSIRSWMWPSLARWCLMYAALARVQRGAAVDPERRPIGYADVFSAAAFRPYKIRRRARRRLASVTIVQRDAASISLELIADLAKLSPLAPVLQL